MPAPKTVHRSALLDATRARRLAREARIREQESRDALARARDVLEPERAPRIPNASSWAQRPLAQGVPVAAPPATPSPNERALAAELREARATLAIARETTRQQRDELTRLRRTLEQLEVNVLEARTERALRVAEDPPISAQASFAESAAGAARAERARLEDRILALERSLADETALRHQLEASIVARDRTLSERAERLAQLNDRLEVQDRALDDARRMAEQERRRNTEAQSVLARLRAALQGSEAEAASESSSAAGLDRPAAASIAEPTACAPLATTQAVEHPASDPRILPPPSAAASPRRLLRAPIFERWREDQIRRHFGPLGIESLADLLREPLARRTHARSTALPILLLGHGSARAARPLAEELVRTSAPDFVLHVADGDGEPVARSSDDDPLRDLVRSHRFPAHPGELADTLRTLIPAVIVCRDFLTWQADLQPWLETLGAFGDAGSCLVFLEETGLGPVTPSPELVGVGERIFELLPERYTLAADGGSPIQHFEDAFAGRAAGARNRLLALLRRRFHLELCAQFGLLAEAFVAGSIASRFDAEAARDQRFLRQIADVDERRQESGEDAPLHMIARIDPAAAR